MSTNSSKGNTAHILALFASSVWHREIGDAADVLGSIHSMQAAEVWQHWRQNLALCCRPHVVIAGALQCIAWLAVLISLQRGQHLQHWLSLATWHLQPVAVALAFVPEVFAGSMSPEDIPLAVALGLGLAFVAAVDWQHAAQHAQPPGPAHLREPLLPAEGMACHQMALSEQQWANFPDINCRPCSMQCAL